MGCAEESAVEIGGYPHLIEPLREFFIQDGGLFHFVSRKRDRCRDVGFVICEIELLL